MESIRNEIRLSYSDPRINALASAAGEAPDSPYRMRYGKNEEYFLEFPGVIEIPHFPIHHDVRVPEPAASYLAPLRVFLEQLVRLLPSTFRDLSHIFDPAETLKPGFYHLYRIQDSLYLFILRADILNRPLETELLEPGTNDLTPSYRTRRLYIESEMIPLERIERQGGRELAFSVRQLLSNTWIGETGRGYQVRGIWMDADLSKFLSHLVLPEGKRLYPFLPLFCKYKTVCAFVPVPESSSRKRILPLLHRILEFLEPETERIQTILKASAFSEANEDFRALRNRVPPSWKETYRDVSVTPYLNERDDKEYELAYPKA